MEWSILANDINDRKRLYLIHRTLKFEIQV